MNTSYSANFTMHMMMNIATMCNVILRCDRAVV